MTVNALFSTLANDDLTILDPPIHFSVGGSSTFQFNISINDDNDFEGAHSFAISFSSEPFLNTGTTPQATIIITDFDGKLFQSACE